MVSSFIGLLDIQSWWEIPCIAHFCSLFSSAFDLPDIDIEDLESALLADGTDESSITLLPDLIISLLKGCDDLKQERNVITNSNYQMFLRRFLRHQCRQFNLENHFDKDTDFQSLPVRNKLLILHSLCHFRLDSEDVFYKFSNLDADSLRVEPLGYDINKSSYWYFFGTRLYREDNTKSNKRKKIIWQVVCFTEEDWKTLALKLEKSKNNDELSLLEIIQHNFLPKLPQLFREREKLRRRKLFQVRNSARIRILADLKAQEIKEKEHSDKNKYQESLDAAKATTKRRRSNSISSQSSISIYAENSIHLSVTSSGVFYSKREKICISPTSADDAYDLSYRKSQTKAKHLNKQNEVFPPTPSQSPLLIQNDYTSNQIDFDELTLNFTLQKLRIVTKNLNFIDNIKKYSKNHSSDDDDDDMNSTNSDSTIDDKNYSMYRKRSDTESLNSTTATNCLSAKLRKNLRKKFSQRNNLKIKPKNNKNNNNINKNKNILNKDNEIKEEDMAPIMKLPGRQTNNSLSSLSGNIFLPNNMENNKTGAAASSGKPTKNLTKKNQKDKGNKKNSTDTTNLGLNEKSLEKTNKKNKKSKTNNDELFTETDEVLQIGMHKVLVNVKNHRDAWPFMDPVEEDIAPRYYSIIRRPMDLLKMEDKLDNGHYKKFSEFRNDFKLIVNNCRLYNGQNNEYTEMVNNLQETFDKGTKKYFDQYSDDDDQCDLGYPPDTKLNVFREKTFTTPPDNVETNTKDDLKKRKSYNGEQDDEDYEKYDKNKSNKRKRKDKDKDKRKKKKFKLLQNNCDANLDLEDEDENGKSNDSANENGGEDDSGKGIDNENDDDDNNNQSDNDNGDVNDNDNSNNEIHLDKDNNNDGDYNMGNDSNIEKIDSDIKKKKKRSINKKDSYVSDDEEGELKLIKKSKKSSNLNKKFKKKSESKVKTFHDKYEFAENNKKVKKSKKNQKYIVEESEMDNASKEYESDAENKNVKIEPESKIIKPTSKKLKKIKNLSSTEVNNDIPIKKKKLKDSSTSKKSSKKSNENLNINEIETELSDSNSISPSPSIFKIDLHQKYANATPTKNSSENASENNDDESVKQHIPKKSKLNKNNSSDIENKNGQTNSKFGESGFNGYLSCEDQDSNENKKSKNNKLKRKLKKQSKSSTDKETTKESNEQQFNNMTEEERNMLLPFLDKYDLIKQRRNRTVADDCAKPLPVQNTEKIKDTTKTNEKKPSRDSPVKKEKSNIEKSKQKTQKKNKNNTDTDTDIIDEEKVTVKKETETEETTNATAEEIPSKIDKTKLAKLVSVENQKIDETIKPNQQDNVAEKQDKSAENKDIKEVIESDVVQDNIKKEEPSNKPDAEPSKPAAKNKKSLQSNNSKSTMEALELETEQTLKDINRWLEHTPRFSEFSSASNSPTRYNLDDFDAVAAKLENEFRRPETSENKAPTDAAPPAPLEEDDIDNTKILPDLIPKCITEEELSSSVIAAIKAKEPTSTQLLLHPPPPPHIKSQMQKEAKRKDMKEKLAATSKNVIIKKKDLLRTIERLQPGKTKGNLLSSNNKSDDNSTNAGNTNQNLIKPKEIKNSLMVKTDENAPKLSLGSVINTEGFGITQLHNFGDEVSSGELKIKEAIKEEINEDSNSEVVVLNDSTDNVNTEQTNEDDIKETEPEGSKIPGTPNLSAWFKAFGAPKKTKKQEEEEEMAAMDKKDCENQNSFDIVKSPSHNEDNFSLPALRRQRNASTGSTISERSSFSQDPESPKIGIDERFNQYSAPYASPIGASPIMVSPKSDEIIKPSSPYPLNGAIKVGFYQDTTTKSSPEKSCSPRELPSPAGASPAGASPAGASPAGASPAGASPYSSSYSSQQQSQIYSSNSPNINESNSPYGNASTSTNLPITTAATSNNSNSYSPSVDPSKTPNTPALYSPTSPVTPATPTLYEQYKQPHSQESDYNSSMSPSTNPNSPYQQQQNSPYQSTQKQKSNSPYHSGSNQNSPYHQPNSPYQNSQQPHSVGSAGPPSVGSLHIATHSPSSNGQTISPQSTHQNESPQRQHSPYPQMNSPYHQSIHSPYNQAPSSQQNPTSPYQASPPGSVAPQQQHSPANYDSPQQTTEQSQIKQTQLTHQKLLEFNQYSNSVPLNQYPTSTNPLHYDQHHAWKLEHITNSHVMSTQSQSPPHVHQSSAGDKSSSHQQYHNYPQFGVDEVADKSSINNLRANKPIAHAYPPELLPSPIIIKHEPQQIHINQQLQHKRIQDSSISHSDYSNQGPLMVDPKSNLKRGIQDSSISHSDYSNQGPLMVDPKSNLKRGIQDSSISHSDYSNQSPLMVDPKSNLKRGIQDSSISHSDYSNHGPLMVDPKSNLKRGIELGIISSNEKMLQPQQSSIFDANALNKQQQMLDTFFGTMAGKNFSMFGKTPMDNITTSKAYEIINKAALGFHKDYSIIQQQQALQKESNLLNIPGSNDNNSSSSQATINVSQHLHTSLKSNNLTYQQQTHLQINVDSLRQQQQIQQHHQSQQSNPNHQPTYNKLPQAHGSTYPHHIDQQKAYNNPSTSSLLDPLRSLNHPLAMMAEDSQILSASLQNPLSASSTGMNTYYEKNMPPAAHMFNKNQIFQSPLHYARDQQNPPQPGNYVPQSPNINANHLLNNQTSVLQPVEPKKRGKKKKQVELSSVNSQQLQNQQPLPHPNPTTAHQANVLAHQGFQLYAGLKSSGSSSCSPGSNISAASNDSSAISLKSSSAAAAVAAAMVSSTAFNFGTGLGLPTGLYGDSSSYLEDFRASTNPYYIPHRVPSSNESVGPTNASTNSAEKSSPGSNTNASSAPNPAVAAYAAHQFLTHQQRAGYPFMNTPHQLDPTNPSIYSQYMRPADELRARMMQGLLQPQGYPGQGYRPSATHLGIPKPYDINKPWF